MHSPLAFLLTLAVLLLVTCPVSAGHRYGLVFTGYHGRDCTIPLELDALALKPNECSNVHFTNPQVVTKETNETAKMVSSKWHYSPRSSGKGPKCPRDKYLLAFYENSDCLGDKSVVWSEANLDTCMTGFGLGNDRNDTRIPDDDAPQPYFASDRNRLNAWDPKSVKIECGL